MLLEKQLKTCETIKLEFLFKYRSIFSIRPVTYTFFPLFLHNISFSEQRTPFQLGFCYNTILC